VIAGREPDARIRHVKAGNAGQQGRPFWASVRCDYERLGAAWSRLGFLGAAAGNRAFRPVVTLRLCQALMKEPEQPTAWFRLRRRLFSRTARMAHACTCHLAGMDLHWDTDIGPGLQIVHGWGLVISPGSRIGADCTLLHGVTIGQNHVTGAGGSVSVLHPVIEDHVWIGPHAVLVGGIRVGRGAHIAAGTLVTRNVPTATIVAGNPMIRVRKVAPGEKPALS
jgi:serine O-acetyltransferase